MVQSVSFEVQNGIFSQSCVKIARLCGGISSEWPKMYRAISINIVGLELKV